MHLYIHLHIDTPLYAHLCVLSDLLLAARTEFSAKHVQALEQWIDALDSALPALTTFILPVRAHTYLYPY